MRVSAAALMLLTFAMARAADRCGPPPELAGFVKSLPPDSPEKRAAIEERLTRNPDDFTLNRLFLESSVYERKPVRERYQQLLAAHPDSLDYQYLRARSLVGSDTKQTLEIYARILEKDPDHPWVHLSQMEIFKSPAFRDRPKIGAEFAAVQRACPSLITPYAYLNDIEDNNVTRQAAAKLRELLKDAKTARELRLYSTLWAVEFRILPNVQQEAERKQVAEDLKRLIPFESDHRIQSAIEQGARLAGDKALEQRMLAARPKRDSVDELVDQSNAWIQKHPQPKPEDPADVRHAYGKELLAKSEEWHKLAPDDDFAIDRVRALTYLDARPEEIGRAVDDVLAVVRSKEGFAAQWIVALARTLLDAGVLLDRIEPLCTEAIARMSDPEAIISIDLAPSRDMTEGNRLHLVGEQMEALLMMAKLLEMRGDRDGAHQLVWQASDLLAAHAPAPGEKAIRITQEYSMARHGLLRFSGEMAEREGRKLDALNLYRDALTARALSRFELRDRQYKLWKELGGTEEGWQQWTNPVVPEPAGKPAPNPDRSAEKRKLPPLDAKDVDGNPWTLDRFANKIVVAVVWATWCEPCRAELPYFARLADRLKGRGDVLVVSLNTDANIAIAQAFAKSNGYSFPIVSARQFAEDLMAPSMSIPRTWIIRDGVIAKEYQGFGRDGDKWVDEVIAGLR